MIQYAWPLVSRDAMLLQIESDGLITIGDCGELTYSLPKKALASWDFGDTALMHSGC